MVDGWQVAYLWVWFPRIVIGAWLMCQFLSCRTCEQNRIVGAPVCVDDCVVAMDQPRSTKDDIHEHSSAVSEFGRVFFCSPSLPHLTKVEAACRLKTIQKDRLLCWTWCHWIFSGFSVEDDGEWRSERQSLGLDKRDVANIFQNLALISC